MSLIGNLVAGPSRDAIDKAVKTAPAAIDKSLAATGATLTGSVDRATLLFNQVYKDLAARIAAWLPTLKPKLLGTIAKLATKTKTWIGTL